MTKRQEKDQVGRDQKITAGSGSVVVGGNVIGSTIVTGNNNRVANVENIFLPAILNRPLLL